MRRWSLVHSRLSPIIGDDGFRVLFARSLHRARAEHPWLAQIDGGGRGNAFPALRASLEAQTRERAASGNRALAAHFNALLNGLIGEVLAARLLRPT